MQLIKDVCQASSQAQLGTTCNIGTAETAGTARHTNELGQVAAGRQRLSCLSVTPQCTCARL